MALDPNTPFGDATKVRKGAGFLYTSAIGTQYPTDLVTPWETVNSAWKQVGYTDAGSTHSVAPNFEAIEVAEELTPLSYDETMREISISFAAAQSVVSNFKRAFNGGAAITSGGVVIFRPPAIGVVTKLQIGWESLDGKERVVYWQCVQTGNVERAHQKAPNKDLISMEFRAEIPGSNSPGYGGAPWYAILDPSLNV